MKNLGLLEKLIPVGVPLPWPTTTPPEGWVQCNGAAFDKSLFPELAKVYPGGNLPDLRGEFIRGWDDGRGVDIGRQILSTQIDAIRNITGRFTTDNFSKTAEGVFQFGAPVLEQSVSGNPGGATIVNFDVSKVVPTANENRPRNITFNYIVRAA
nr:phage tail protein [Photorhabdus sp. CRCIA-P01]